MRLDLIGEWAAVVPTALLLTAVLYGVGGVALALVRTRMTAVLAGGPLITAAVLAVGGLLANSMGIVYGWWCLLLITAVLWGAAALIRLLQNRDRNADESPTGLVARRSLPQRAPLALVVAGLLGISTMWLPAMLATAPHEPSPRVDPMYHYNVLNAIEETGVVSMFAAVDFNYGVQVSHVFYPTVWHAVAFLGVPLVGIIAAANALTYLVTPILFVVNSALLGRVVFHRSPAATATAAIAAGILPAFPGGLAFTRAFWPNELAVAMLPGLLVLMILLLRRSRPGLVRSHPWTYLLTITITLTAIAGLGFTHPSVFFSFVLIAVPLLLGAVLKALRVVRRTMSRRAHHAFVLVLIGVSIICVTILFIPDQVRSFVMRQGVQRWDDFLLKGVSMMVNWPTDVENPAGVLMALVYIPLVVIGIWQLWHRREHRWVTVAWVIQLLVIAGSYFPLPLFSSVSGLWYSDTFRLYAVQAVILPLVITACAAWVQGLRSEKGSLSMRVRWTAVWAAILAGLLGTAYITLGGARNVGWASPDARPVAVSPEWELLERTDQVLPGDAIVIGDPASGVAYVPLVSDADSVFTQMNTRDVDEDGAFLLENFDDIHQDPRVCDLLEHYGIGYFYEDAPFEYNYSEREEVMPGFYEVDTSDGFTLLDEGGGAKVWRIDACGPIEPNDAWWQRAERKDPLIDGLDSGQPDVLYPETE